MLAGILVGALAGGTVSSLASGVEAPLVVRVGLVVDGPWVGNAEMLRHTVEEVGALTEGEFDVRFPAELYLVGDWTFDTAREHLERLLADPRADLVITWGMLASHAVCCTGNLPKPVIAPVIIDRVLQDVPYEAGASGVPNLTYVSLPNTLASELRLLREMVPFSRVAVLTNAALVEAAPRLQLRTRAVFEELGLEFELIPVGDRAAPALAAISPEADAVFSWPLFHLGGEELQRLIDGINARRLPSFSALGGEDVERGFLASLGSGEFLPRLTRRVALNLQRILLGEDAGTLPVAFDTRDRLTLNMATARAIGVSPSWSALVEARLLHPEPADRPTRSLAESVERAIASNLDLAAERLAVAAGAEEVVRARAVLGPRIDLAALGLEIDEDRAAASFGSQPERSLTASLGLSQLVFSEPARANLAIQRRLQAGREQGLETARLDLTLEAAVTYLDLLRAKTQVSIQRNNLELTRSNLELARIRRTVGVANPAEVFRWESEIAVDRKALVEAMARRRVAEVALNRLLDRPLEERFLTVEVGLDDPSLITGQERFRGTTSTPARFRVLRDFLAEEGLAASPELAGVDEAIAAAERALASARRAFWVPTIGFEAALDERLSSSGAGSGAGAAALFPGLTAPDDRTWSLGLAASLPLLSGGSRRAEARQAELELERLRLARRSAAEKIAQRIRAGAEVARASFVGIGLAGEASEAARRSLELVSDAYARGAVSILDLLDAQNTALNAELLAADAIYDFFIDLMEVQRAANRFDFFLGGGELEAWYQRLEAYFERAGAAPEEMTP